MSFVRIKKMSARYKINGSSDSQVLCVSSGILKGGGILIVPTDTVYGIVCDGYNEKGKEKIYAVKNRSREKPLIAFANSIEKAGEIAEIPENFNSFIAGKWPGATTFIFKSKFEIPYCTSGENKIGIRIPGYPFLLKLLRNFKFLASTSANISGEKSALSVDEISPDVLEKADVVIDAGEICGRESTIWDLTGSIPLLLRGRILFVCEVNRVRSVMAEFLVKKYVKNPAIKISSAGIAAVAGKTADREIAQVLRTGGIEVKNFVSTVLNIQEIKTSDLIFVMQESQKEIIISHVPEANGKTVVLDVPAAENKEISHLDEIRDIIEQRIKTKVLTRISK
jgi:L-threonylcarbamoyladenylate synthase